MANTDPVPPTTTSDLYDAAGNQGGISPAGTGQPTVWLGGYYTVEPSAGPSGNVSPSAFEQRKKRVTLDEGVAAYYGLSYQDKGYLKNFALKMGMSPNDVSDTSLAKVWAQYVQAAAGYQAAGKDMTPWSVMFMDQWGREEAKKQGMAPKGPVTTTQRQANLSTGADARAIFLQASKSLLGRDPTDAEASRFFTSLNAMERENPNVTTTTTSYNAEGDISSQESTSSGGVSAAAKDVLAMDQAKANPEYGAYQAATTYKDALMDLVFGKGY